MTRTKRSIEIGRAVCLVALSALSACAPPAVSSERPPAALTSSGSGDGSGIGSGSGSGSGVPCTDCSCPGDCDAGSALACPSGACNAAGTCACDPAFAATDCPSTGCCDAVIDLDGEPMQDPSGAPVYQCVTPDCTTDGDCGNGEVCLAGATCGQARCGCRHGEGPDPDQPCCVAVNTLGVCCTSGQVDPGGSCVCPDPRMSDRGNGCECPDGMVADDAGACVCPDPHAAFDPGGGSCACAAGYRPDFDPYSGDTTCMADADGPDPCPDPHAGIDPATGDCVCQPGFVLGDTLETVTAQCVPPTCGDGVCGPGETCDLCSYDCGACGPDGGPPDAGVPDAGHLDAGVPDAGHLDAGHLDAGHLDAGVPDAGMPDAGHLDAGHLDAGHLDAMPLPSDAALPTRDAMVCGPSGSGAAVRCLGSGAP